MAHNAPSVNLEMTPTWGEQAIRWRVGCYSEGLSNVFLWQSRPSTHWAVLARVWLKKAIPPLSSELMRSITPGTLCSGEAKTSQKLGLPQQRNPAEDHTDNEGAEAHAVSGEAKSSVWKREG